jgi:hypothetical protein
MNFKGFYILGLVAALGALSLSDPQASHFMSEKHAFFFPNHAKKHGFAV